MVPLAGHNVCSASEDETDPGPVIESVTVDLESFRTNPWNIFGMYVTISPAPADTQADMAVEIAVHSLAGSMIPDAPLGLLRVSGNDVYRGLLTFAHDPASIETNHDGSFASSMLTLRHNVTVDSYDSSLGYSETDTATDGGNLYSNGTIRLLDNATVYGQAAAHSFESSADATLSGGISETDRTWDSLTANVPILKETVRTTNSNDRIDGPFLYDDAVLLLQGDDQLTLPEGVYHFGSIDLSGQCHLAIEGKVIIFCDNTIAISDEAEVNIDGVSGDLTMFSFDRDISVTDSARVVARLYAVNGCIGLSGQAEVFGRLSAAFIDMSDQARLHIDRHDSDIQLHFSVVSLPGSDTEKQVHVFGMMTTTVWQWRIDVLKTLENTHAHFNRFIKIGKVWSTVGEKIGLRGAGDYDLFCKLNEFKAVIEEVYDNSVFDYLLHYQVLVNNQWVSGTLNFWRSWAYSWDNREETTTPPTGSRDQYDQPWEYKTTNFLNGHHIYDLRYAQSCDGLVGWECYWYRAGRIMEDALRSGVILQMDLFDLAMPQLVRYWGDPEDPEEEVFWHYNPFHPDNQYSQYRNELDVDYFNLNKFYSSFYTPAVYPRLKLQQETTVEIIVNAMKNSGVTFFRVANEPKIKPSSANDANKAIAFFDGVEQKAYDTFTPQNSTPYLMAAMVYNTPEFTYTAHQNALLALFNGVSGFFDGLAHPERFKIISYHQPYWLFNADCTHRINALKTWHDSNFATKAIIVDTDGASVDCRDGTAYFPPTDDVERNIFRYAYKAYENSEEPFEEMDPADFNCKSPYWNQPGHENQLYLDQWKLYEIDRAYNIWW